MLRALVNHFHVKARPAVFGPRLGDMTSSVPGHFVNLARRFGVAEADLLVLEHAKVLCAQDLFFKFPDESARERLLNEVIKPYYGERDPETQDLLLRDRNLTEEEEAGISLSHGFNVSPSSSPSIVY